MRAWNMRPEWLREAVASALAQQGGEIELVVVDDGSDIPVATLLEDVRDERLRIVRIEHGGTSRASTAGVQASSGTRLRFVDADDTLPATSTAHLLGLAADDSFIAYGATELC